MARNKVNVSMRVIHFIPLFGIFFRFCIAIRAAIAQEFLS